MKRTPRIELRDSNDRRGIILIVVMIVVVILSLAGFSFAAFLFTEIKGVRLRGDELQLDSALASGAALMESLASQPPAARDGDDGPFREPDAFREMPIGGERDALTAARVSLVIPSTDEAEESPLRFGMENESARLNLMAVAEWDRLQPGAGQKALLALPGMTPPIADAILDWVDADSQQRPNGAEVDEYRGLDRSYSPRNGRPAAIEELLLVKGVTRELLFGLDANRNGRADENESQATPRELPHSPTESSVPWARLLTLFSAERNETAAGQLRIDLNDPALPQLHAKLRAALKPEQADFVVLYRQFGSPALVPSAGAVAPAAGATAVDLTKPAAMRIAALVDLVGVVLNVAGPDGKTTAPVASPFRNDPESLRSDFLPFCDLVTTESMPVIPGRVNVEHAPAEVLRAIPGFDDAAVAQVIAGRRSGKSSKAQAHRTAEWLLAEGILDVARMKQAAPFVTAGGDVYRSQLVASLAGSRATARVEAIVDGTHRPARTLAWNDLRALGPGFPELVVDPENPGEERKMTPAAPRTSRSR